LIGIAVASRLPTLGDPLVESNAFRQTQTAYASVIYHRAGIDLLHTPLPTIGPPGELPFELPLYQAAAALAMNAGLPTEVALRGTDLVFFIIAAGALLLLLRTWGATASPAVVLAAFMFSPLSIEWSRASTIEYLAVAAALGAAASLRRLEGGGTPGRLIVASCLVALSFLAKFTTGLVWLVPAAIVARRRPLVAAVVGFGLLVGLAWTRYGDAIKATGPLTSRLTSTGVADYLVGDLGARLDPVVWAAILANAAATGLLWLLGLLLARRIPADERRLAALCGLAVAAAVVLFPTLYALHGYYFVAISPAFAILAGVGVESALRSRSVRYVALVGSLLVVATFAMTAPVWTRALGPSDPDNELVSAAQVRSSSNPADELIIVGRDYSPAILFYAGRNGIALPASATLGDVPPEILRRSIVFDCGVDRIGTCRVIHKPDAS
jgi:hypothetical protein